MPIDLTVLCRSVSPEETVLLFGAGSSFPSGAPIGKKLAELLAEKFKIASDSSLSLPEIASLSEKAHSRKELVAYLRSIFNPLAPTGGLMNLPNYDWKSIYTTNYDTLIEQVYKKHGKNLITYKSNFNFGLSDKNTATKLFKLHGSIDEDVADGHVSRLIITLKDYDLANEYRELLFDNFKIQISSGNLVIIGYSLADPDLKAIVDEALRRKRDAGASGKIFLLLYEKDENRAALYEERGISVCFGGLDDFFAEIAAKIPSPQLSLSISDNPLDLFPELRPITIDVAHAVTTPPNAYRMFNGSSATYADIANNLTFDRELANQLETQLASDGRPIAYVLGAAGVGKSSAVRQAMVRLSQRGFLCWEHKDDFSLPADEWQKLAKELSKREAKGVLLIDQCHNHMRNISRIADFIGAEENSALKIILISTKHQWNPRQKSSSIFVRGSGYELSQLIPSEIESLLDLLDREQEISKLVEDQFKGFSRTERKRRLEDRCSADMFVCLKNIFAFDSIDHIILAEYGELASNYQEIYRTVSAMEAAGVKVHRQLILRTLNISAGSVASILENMTDIIHEYTIDEKEGLYGWRGRHSVVAEILTEYKYSDQKETYALFENIIKSLNPTYGIEIRTMRGLCDMKAGLGKIIDKDKQNYLLRRMISIAPGERVPRHRLISNLIDEGKYEQADTEIRIFENELKLDAPTQRYKIKLQLRRAEHTKGLMQEDRATIVAQAANIALDGIRKFPEDKNSYSIYCEVGYVHLRLTGKYEIYDDAMRQIREAEERIMDPELRRIISAMEGRAERLLTGGGWTAAKAAVKS